MVTPKSRLGGREPPVQVTSGGVGPSPGSPPAGLQIRPLLPVAPAAVVPSTPWGSLAGRRAWQLCGRVAAGPVPAAPRGLKRLRGGFLAPVLGLRFRGPLRTYPGLHAWLALAASLRGTSLGPGAGQESGSTSSRCRASALAERLSGTCRGPSSSESELRCDSRDLLLPQ